MQMIGGHMKTTSRLAIAAAGSFFLGGLALTPAKAADLGGNCCADLEERIADLEATTVRKNKRNITITISGQVNKELLWWDDGAARRADIVENNASPTRLRFEGSAKINPTLNAGYVIEMGFGTEAGSRRVDQIQAMRGQVERMVNAQNGVNSLGADGFFTVRYNYIYLKDAKLGEVRLGHLNSISGEVFGLDLSGATGLTAPFQFELQGGGLYMRRSDVQGNGALVITRPANAANGQSTFSGASTIRWANVLGDTQQARDGWRSDQIRYETPTFMGFAVSGSYSSENLIDVGAKFANEFNGLRVAAGIGYTIDNDESAGQAGAATNACTTQNAAPPCTTSVVLQDNLLPSPSGSVDNRYLVVGGSLWHIPTGLFVSGNYEKKEFRGTATNITGAGPIAGATTPPGVQRPDASTWQIVAGVKKNFFGVGATNVYGEYGKSDDWMLGQTKDFSGLGTNTTANSSLSFSQVTKSEATTWGVGLIQTIDAANMDLYVGYRHYSADIQGVTAQAPNTPIAAPLNDLSVVMTGARIQF